MPNYQFTLITTGADLLNAEIADALFEAGCDDALLSVTDEVFSLDFDREAASLADAVLSAIADVESVASIEVLRLAEAGLLSMAAIAEQCGRTRESVRLLVAGERGPGGFPAPVTDPRSRYRIWRSTDVERWFMDNFDGLGDKEHSNLLSAINAALELRRFSPADSGERVAILERLVGV